MIKIGIVGSRRRNSSSDFKLLYKKINELINKYGTENITLISGGCPQGADHFAEIINEEINLPNKMIIHYPDKNKLDSRLVKTNIRAAYAIINYARNTLIAEDSEILIAMVASDRKGGTEDTIKKYKKFGKNNLIIL